MEIKADVESEMLEDVGGLEPEEASVLAILREQLGEGARRE